MVSNRQVFPNSDLTTWLVNTNFRPDVAVYSFTTTDELSNRAALKALDEMQHSSIPLLEIENCLCRNLLNTARQCAMNSFAYKDVTVALVLM